MSKNTRSSSKDQADRTVFNDAEQTLSADVGQLPSASVATTLNNLTTMMSQMVHEIRDLKAAATGISKLSEELKDLKATTNEKFDSVQTKLEGKSSRRTTPSALPGIPQENEVIPTSDNDNISSEGEQVESERLGESRDHMSSTRLHRTYSGPIVINQIQPDTFDGDRGKARSWLTDYSTTMDINNFSNQAKVTKARAYMTGKAKDWANVTLTSKPDLTWTEFKEEFLQHFCGIDHLFELQLRLDKLRQRPDEHPSDFLVRTMALCNQKDKHMPDKERVSYVARGLEASVNNLLSCAKSRNEWTIDWIRGKLSQYQLPRVETSRTTSGNKKPTSAHSKGVDNNKTPLKIRDLKNWTCLNCNTKGHAIGDCSQPRDEKRIQENHAALKLKKANKVPEPDRSANLLDHRPSRSRSPKGKTSRLPCDDLAKPRLIIKINNIEVTGRIDTGADMTTFPQRFIDPLDMKILPWEEPPMSAANQTPVHVMGKSPVLAEFGNRQTPLLVAIVPNDYLKEPLFGNDVLQYLAIDLPMSQITSSPITKRDVAIVKADVSQLPKDLPSESSPHPIDQISFGTVSPEDRQDLDTMLLEHADTFSRHELDIGRTSTVTHRIHLTDDKPIHRQPYRIHHRNRTAMFDAIQKGLASGALRESKSPYASPVFFVDKDHGKDQRLVVDYRALNSKTIPDRTPMPHPEDVFSLLAGSTIYAKLDITSMFNQIEIDLVDVHKTAITTPFGLYEYLLMPFGLINAPATAVRLMREVLKGLDSTTCYVYFDDIIIFATDAKQLNTRLRDVLDRLKKHNLKLKPSKCYLAVESVHFLGHVISKEGIQVNPTRVMSVRNFPIPSEASHVRSFHGLCSYNRKFIKDFAHIAKPLTPLMAVGSTFKWSSSQQQAFEKLRDALIKAPILVHFDPEADHELRTDASAYAIGAILYQKGDKSTSTGTVLYYSKTLSPTQQRYSATERELLAAFKAITELQHYLYGKKFTLVTDHSALSLLKNNKDPHGRLSRWVAQLQCFDFDVVYKSGAKHVDADCLSRLIKPVDSSKDVDVDQNSEEAKFIIRNICSLINSPHSVENHDQDNAEDVLDEETINIRQEQLDDEYCAKFIKILKDSTKSRLEKEKDAPRFTLQDDLLYRVQHHDIFLLVIPQLRRTSVLRSCHDAPLAGHFGYARTYALAKSRYYWPKMRREIQRYVASCETCQKRRPRNVKRSGFIKPLPIAQGIFDFVGIDLLSKLPKSISGYVALLVCTDNLSKYVITVPLRSETSNVIMFAFYDAVITKFGCPKVVLSDRGINLTSAEANSFFSSFGIKRKLTSAYHPQTNGQTERFNKTIANSLTHYVSKNQSRWSDYIQAITFAYNISEHTVTKIAPFELVFGKRPRLPLDNLLQRNEFVSPYYPTLDLRTQLSWEMMRRLITKSQEMNKKRLDKKLVQPNFEEGDEVLFERPTLQKGGVAKLTMVFAGPYKISRKVSDLTYELEPLNENQRPTVGHAYNLRKFIRRENFPPDTLVDVDFVPTECVDIQQPQFIDNPEKEASTQPTTEVPILDQAPSTSEPFDAPVTETTSTTQGISSPTQLPEATQQQPSLRSSSLPPLVTKPYDKMRPKLKKFFFE